MARMHRVVGRDGAAQDEIFFRPLIGFVRMRDPADRIANEQGFLAALVIGVEQFDRGPVGALLPIHVLALDEFDMWSTHDNLLSA